MSEHIYLLMPRDLNYSAFVAARDEMRRRCEGDAVKMKVELDPVPVCPVELDGCYDEWIAQQLKARAA